MKAFPYIVVGVIAVFLVSMVVKSVGDYKQAHQGKVSRVTAIVDGV